MKKTIILVVILLLALSVNAYTTQNTLNLKWSKKLGGSIAAIASVNIDQDGKEDIIVALQNNTVLVYNTYGEKINEFYIGDKNTIGSVTSIKIADVDGDLFNELIFGLGGAKEIRTYEPQDFEVGESGMEQKDKVLYKVLRYHGAVYVTELNGDFIWRHLMQDSVKSVDFLKTKTDGNFVVAGVGDLKIYTYNERSDAQTNRTVCTDENTTNEVARWATEADCINPSNCCDGVRRCFDCTSTWDSEDELCTRSYTQTVCGVEGTGILGWVYTDYKEYNSSVLFLDKFGKKQKEIPLFRVDEDDGKIINKALVKSLIVRGTTKPDFSTDVDNRIRNMVVGDVDYDGSDELVVVANSGVVFMITATNLSSTRIKWRSSVSDTGVDSQGRHYVMDPVRSVYVVNINDEQSMEVIAGDSLGFIKAFDLTGQTIWKQRINGAVTDIVGVDVELDSNIDLAVSSSDRNIYVFDSSGSILWSYPSKDSLYSIIVGDMDFNGLDNYLVTTSDSMIMYETNEFYVKKAKADSYYIQAYDNFMDGDYSKASIYVDISKQIYQEIGELDSIPKCNLLRSKIDDEFRLKTKQEADKYYALALNYYSLNDFDATLRNLDEAERIYGQIKDEGGISKVRTFKNTVADEKRSQKKIIGNGLYSQAVAMKNFGNYTASLDLARKAKILFEEAEYYNESLNCDYLILSIGDKYMELARNNLQIRKYDVALQNAGNAKNVYESVQQQSRVSAAEKLMEEINFAKDNSEVVEDEKPDYTPYIIGLAILSIIILLYSKLKPRGISSQIPQDDLSDIDELEEII